MDVKDLVKRLHQGRIDKAGIRRSPDKVKREAADALQSLAAERDALRDELAAIKSAHRGSISCTTYKGRDGNYYSDLCFIKFEDRDTFNGAHYAIMEGKR